VEEALPFNLKQVREEAEKQAIIRALNHVGENVSQAAKLLGVTRPTLYNMMEKYGLNK
jgi:two-component system NtrC family response regulator